MEDRLDKAKAKHAMYVKTFTGPEGEAVLLDLMTSVGIMAPSFDARDPDPQSTAFREGEKSVVYRIIQQLKLNPEKYLKLLEQNYYDEE